MAKEQKDERSKRRLILHVIQRGFAVAVLAAVAAGAYLYMREVEHGPGPNEAARHASAQPPDVAVVRVENQSVALSPSFIGQAQAFQQVEIRARVNGFVEEQGFEEGSRVEKGQLLFRIDPRSFQAAVDIAEARLASAQATYHRAQQQLDRAQRLVEKNAATANELEQWQTDAGVAEANVQLAEAELKQAKLELSYTSIESPINGMIAESLKDVGSYADAGANSLLAVVRQINPIYATYRASESDLLRWRSMVERGELTMPGPNEQMEVALTLSDGSLYPRHGVLDFIDVAIDPSTGTAQLRATVPNPDGSLRPGQFVQVHPLGMTRTGAVLAPQTAVMQTPTGASVYVMDGDSKVEQRKVELGEWFKDDWLIKKGLRPGDRLIVNNLQKIHPGMTVDPMAPASAPARTDAPDRTRPKAQASR